MRGDDGNRSPVTMKYWHRFKAWLVGRKIRREHQELAKFVRRSAYEITAWKQDIGFLEEVRAYHLIRSGRPYVEAPLPGKVVPISSVEQEPIPALPPAAHMA